MTLIRCFLGFVPIFNECFMGWTTFVFPEMSLRHQGDDLWFNNTRGCERPQWPSGLMHYRKKQKLFSDVGSNPCSSSFAGPPLYLPPFTTVTMSLEIKANSPKNKCLENMKWEPITATIGLDRIPEYVSRTLSMLCLESEFSVKLYGCRALSRSSGEDERRGRIQSSLCLWRKS